MIRIDGDWFTDNLNVATVAVLTNAAEERTRAVFSILAGPKLGGFGGRLERRITEAFTTGQGPGAPYGSANLTPAEACSVIMSYRSFVLAETAAQGVPMWKSTMLLDYVDFGVGWPTPSIRDTSDTRAVSTTRKVGDWQTYAEDLRGPLMKVWSTLQKYIVPLQKRCRRSALWHWDGEHLPF